jgi:Centromere DNA-binding protein complex CBF3 subunit, domain 2
MAGFNPSGDNYYLGRDIIEPPQELLNLVFPWLIRWDSRFRKRSQKLNWEEGGLDETDEAGRKFIDLLLFLRRVLLQDLAVLQLGKPWLFSVYFRYAPPLFLFDTRGVGFFGVFCRRGSASTKPKWWTGQNRPQ